MVLNDKVFKAIQAFAYNKKERQVLQCANIKDGYVYVSDSHIGLKAPTDLPDMLINLFTLKKSEDNYPYIDKIFQESAEDSQKTKLTQTDLVVLYQVAKMYKRKGDYLHVYTSDDGRLIVAHYLTEDRSDNPSEVTKVTTDSGGSVDFVVSGLLLYKVLNYLLLSNSDAEMWFFAPLRPVQFVQTNEDGKQSTLLLTPVRTF